MHSFYLDAIRKFEGYTPQATLDYAQFSNGYGTRARFAGEVIDRAEAERRFQSEVSNARSIVEKAAPDVDEGTKAALTSLTYNAGSAWVDGGLGDAVRRGDLSEARDIFQKYTKAGGEVLPGLVSRRAQEALWIGNPEAMAVAGLSGGASSAGSAGLPSVVQDQDQSVVRLAEMLRPQSGQTSGSAGRDSLAWLERGPRAEHVASTGASKGSSNGDMGSAARDALIALVDADGLAGGSVADITRLAKLGRGSELARPERDRDNNETRRA